MKELYSVEGTLNRGFRGQITYTVCLEEPCDQLDVHLTYDYAELRYRDEKADLDREKILKIYGTEEHYRECPPITPAVLEKTIRGNGQRLNIHKLKDLCCDEVRITVRETYGHESARVYEVRLY